MASAAITSHDIAATSESESGEERGSITFRGGGVRAERTGRAQPADFRGIIPQRFGFFGELDFAAAKNYRGSIARGTTPEARTAGAGGSERRMTQRVQYIAYQASHRLHRG